MRLHHRFEWDSAKAAINVRKHGVSFETAAHVMADAQGTRTHVEDFDDPHSIDEDRWITTGSHPDARDIVLRIVWTRRGAVTRIISARLATRKERVEYENELQNR
jgi:uncharacterized protein